MARFGYRSSINDRHRDEHIRDTEVIVHDLRDIRRWGIQSCVTGALATVARAELDGFWLHFDVDVLDEDLMRAVDYREPDGLTWEEVAQVVSATADTGRLVGLQVTIYNPSLDDPGSPRAAQIVDLLTASLSVGP